MDFEIDTFEKHSDNRGDLVVFLKKSDLPLKVFGQIYFVTFEGIGTVRGQHYHKKWTEWFGIVSGAVEVRLEDVRSGETKQFVIDANNNEYTRLRTGPFIAHGFKSLTETASLVNYADSEWEPNDTFRKTLF